jgi:Antirestriction protein
MPISLFALIFNMPSVIYPVVEISASLYICNACSFMRRMFGDQSERGALCVEKWFRKIVGAAPSEFDYYELSNGGYFVAPKGNSVQTEAPNDFAADMSCEAAGLVVCLYVYSHLAYEIGPQGGWAYHLTNQYLALRCYAVDHPESVFILASIDQ